MAQLEEALYSRLSGYSGLTSLVSTRIYPLVLPEGPTYPAVTYQRIDTQRDHLMGADDSAVSALVQVDSWAETYLGAKAVGQQVRAALQRWRGTAAAVTIEDSLLDAERDNPYEPDSTFAGLYRVSMDFNVWYRE